MTAVLANALPIGFSGVVAAVGHDTFDIVYFAPTFVEVLQIYTSQTLVHLNLD